jgi:hypothetical protein
VKIFLLELMIQNGSKIKLENKRKKKRAEEKRKKEGVGMRSFHVRLK